MSSICRPIAMLVLGLVILSSLAWAQEGEITPLEIGAYVPDFNLPGVDGNDWSPASFKDAEILVVIFTCNHCPTAQAYEGRIKALAAGYKDKGVAFVAISPNDPCAVRLDELGYSDLSDSFPEMRIRAKYAGFNFPYLYDGAKQEVSRKFGPQSTPHVFIFDKERKLRYEGAIDNSEHIERAKIHYVRNALDALLEGKEPSPKKTRSTGCSIKWSDKRGSVRESLEKWAKEEVKLSAIDANGVKELLKNEGKKLRLVNVWASWCAPCRMEFPQLMIMNQMYRGRAFELVTLNVEGAERTAEIMAFLKQMRASNTNYRFQSGNPAELVGALGNGWMGELPFTLLIKPGGEVIYTHKGVVDVLELRRKIVDYLGRTYK
jgi:thiol-disulfide isomerase/thioredoxin